jgi:hypothetical protein
LAWRINWKSKEKDFTTITLILVARLYRFEKSLGVLLKQMYNQSDEAFVDRKIENP